MKTVYTSTCLERYYPSTFQEIKRAVTDTGNKFDTVEGLANVWVRDWAPIPTTNFGFVKFHYELRWGSKMRIPLRCWNKLVRSYINLDGGNVEQGATKVLITEMVFKRNPKQSRTFLRKYLENMFRKEIVFLPVEPDDTLGHIDGMARFVDDKTVIINDTSSMKSRACTAHQVACEVILQKAGLKVQHMPYAYDECPKMTDAEFRKKFPNGDEYNPAVGYYINFLKLENAVLVPQFGLDKDEVAIDVLKGQFPNCAIRGIRCYDLAMTGGCVNCVTWEN